MKRFVGGRTINPIEIVRIKWLEFRENVTVGFLSPGTKQTVCNNEVSILSGCLLSGFDCYQLN